jgi:hypothetical protein
MQARVRPYFEDIGDKLTKERWVRLTKTFQDAEKAVGEAGKSVEELAIHVADPVPLFMPSDDEDPQPDAEKGETYEDSKPEIRITRGLKTSTATPAQPRKNLHPTHNQEGVTIAGGTSAGPKSKGKAKCTELARDDYRAYDATVNTIWAISVSNALLLTFSFV